MWIQNIHENHYDIVFTYSSRRKKRNVNIQLNWWTNYTTHTRSALPQSKPSTLNTPYYFSPNNFTYSWTLFSKFFSSFPHGTCLLSVSKLYWALGQLYVPLQVAIPSNPTLWTHVTYCSKTAKVYTGQSPSTVHHSRWLTFGCALDKCVNTLQLHSEKTEQILKLDFSWFTRRY